jgi:hypothetical protein
MMLEELLSHLTMVPGRADATSAWSAPVVEEAVSDTGNFSRQSDFEQQYKVKSRVHLDLEL